MDIEYLFQQLQDTLTTHLPKILSAIAVLVLGFILSYICMSLFRNILKKLDINKKLSSLTSKSIDEFKIERWSGRIVFSIIMLFVLIVFFQTLGLSSVNNPLNALLEPIFSYLPRLVAPLVLFFIAWLIATTLKFTILKLSKKMKIEDKIKSLEYKPHKDDKISVTFAEIIYWLVFVLFLPVVLDSLALKGLLGPINNMIEKLLGFLPNLFAAVIVVFVGWVAAKIVQKITINFLSSVGVNALSDKVGLSKMIGSYKLSDVLGTTAYIIILIPVIIAGLSSLKIDSITKPASNMLNQILTIIPLAFAAAGILIIAYIGAKYISELLATFLKELGFDNVLVKLGISLNIQQDQISPSRLASYALLFTIMLFAFIEASNVIGLTKLSEILTEFTYFIGNVAFGVFVFAIGLYLAKLVAGIIKNSSSPHAYILSVISKTSIIILSGAVALEQIAIADNIIAIAFGVVLAGIALAFGIAFGLGGREEASKILSELKKKL